MGKLSVLFFLFSFLAIHCLAQKQHVTLGDTTGIKLGDTSKEMEGGLQSLSQPSPDQLVIDPTTTLTNISAQLGGAALLPCRLLTDDFAVVSWVRQKDWFTISLRKTIFEEDKRFQIVHSNSDQDWDLQIKPVQKGDNGTYECKVASSSGIISHYYHLHVVVPVVYILGSRDYHIGKGSTISLICILENSTNPVQDVFWYHNDKMVNYDSARGGVTVSIDSGLRIRSKLNVNNAAYSDSGNYTCRANDTEPVTVQVFVTKDTTGMKLEETSKEMKGGLQSQPSPDRLVFDPTTTPTNISAQLGGAALLPCRLNTDNFAVVSWVRRKDWLTISSGKTIHEEDKRFQIVHSNSDQDWDLQIKPVQRNDNGMYECKVATSSGTISHVYNLHVVVPVASILGSGDYHIGEGSTISLVCIIENSPTPLQYVFWYHNDKMVNYDSARDDVTVSTEPGLRIRSTLTVNNASYLDSGNYTCKANNTESDTVNVFVTEVIHPPKSSVAVSINDLHNKKLALTVELMEKEIRLKEMDIQNKEREMHLSDLKILKHELELGLPTSKFTEHLKPHVNYNILDHTSTPNNDDIYSSIMHL